LLKTLQDQLIDGLLATSLFPTSPTVRAESVESHCCDRPLIVLKTKRKTIVTLDIGKFRIHETIKHCECCGLKYAPTELHELAPQYGNFGFDVLEYVGRSLFLEYRNEKEVVEQLRRQNIVISEREVAFLGKKFVVYLALAHKEKIPEIRKWIQENGGYILHFDGTCDGSSPHLLCAIDEVADIVLGSTKALSESEVTVSFLLQDIKEGYGEPLALVSDMGRANLAAAGSIFPGISHYMCHFHFLRDIGKDLFGEEEKYLKQVLHGIKASLSKLAKRWKKYIDVTADLSHHLQNIREVDQCDFNMLPDILSVYLLTTWILDYSSELSGYGFPFDRANLSLCNRILTVYDILKTLPQTKTAKYLNHLCMELEAIFGEDDLRVISLMEEKAAHFDELREAMQIALPDGKQGLNDDGTDSDIATIKERVARFTKSEEIVRKVGKDCRYTGMLAQIKKYWDKLFTAPIAVTNGRGETVYIQPQRTNNIMERSFREMNRGNRKKTGGKSLGRLLQTMLAETPLIRNLRNERYMEIVLNGRATLADRFSEIDANKVRERIMETKSQEDLIPANVRKLLKIPEFACQFDQPCEEIIAS